MGKVLRELDDLKILSLLQMCILHRMKTKLSEGGAVAEWSKALVQSEEKIKVSNLSNPPCAESASLSFCHPLTIKKAKF